MGITWGMPCAGFCPLFPPGPEGPLIPPGFAVPATPPGGMGGGEGASIGDCVPELKPGGRGGGLGGPVKRKKTSHLETFKRIFDYVHMV